MPVEIGADQASGLRTLLQASPPAPWLFISASVGPNQGRLVADLGFDMAQQGLRVLILDECTGPVNVNSHLGIRPRYELAQALEGHVALEKVLRSPCPGLKTLDLSRTLDALARGRFAPGGRALFDVLERLMGPYDRVLIHARVSSPVSLARRFRRPTVVVLEPTRAALQNGLEVLRQFGDSTLAPSVGVVFDRVAAPEVGELLWQRLVPRIPVGRGHKLCYLGTSRVAQPIENGSQWRACRTGLRGLEGIIGDWNDGHSMDLNGFDDRSADRVDGTGDAARSPGGFH